MLSHSLGAPCDCVWPVQLGDHQVEAGKHALREEAKHLCLSQIRARELARTESRYEFEKERALAPGRNHGRI